MGVKLLIKHNYEEKKKKFLIENVYSYLRSEDLPIDVLVLLGFFGDFIFRSSDTTEWRFLCHLLLMLKIKTLLMMLGHIELSLI